jgi:hypothetical protein
MRPYPHARVIMPHAYDTHKSEGSPVSSPALLSPLARLQCSAVLYQSTWRWSRRLRCRLRYSGAPFEQGMRRTSPSTSPQPNPHRTCCWTLRWRWLAVAMFSIAVTTGQPVGFKRLDGVAEVGVVPSWGAVYARVGGAAADSPGHQQFCTSSPHKLQSTPALPCETFPTAARERTAQHRDMRRANAQHGTEACVPIAGCRTSRGSEGSGTM